YELYDLFVFFVSHSNIISPLWGAFLLFFKQSQIVKNEFSGRKIYCSMKRVLITGVRRIGFHIFIFP
ncbi:hypothetical protein, partial [Hydrogenobacter hydrogenophilus]